MGEFLWRQVFSTLSSMIETLGNSKLLRFAKIQPRLTIMFIVLLLAAITLTNFISFREASGAITTKAELYSKQIVEQSSQNISLDLQQIEKVSEDISMSDEVQISLKDYNGASQEKKVCDSHKCKESICQKNVAVKLYI